MDSQLVQSEVILGVDTHLDTHVAAVISHAGRLLGTLTTPANAAGTGPKGLRRAIAWIGDR